MDGSVELTGADINRAKIRLANEVTAMLHGISAAREAEVTANDTFEKGINSAGLPTIMIERSKLEGTGVLQASVLTGLALSNGEGRRHIKAGALKINGVKVTDHEYTLSQNDFKDGSVKISIGKKRHAILKLHD
jgi:tyrosyl-tRNA synthetase